MNVTVDQLRTLWNNPLYNAVIDRGDEHPPVTKEDLRALMSQLDTDDEGVLMEGQWDLLAEEINSETERTCAAEELLMVVSEAREERDQKRQGVDEQFNRLIRDVMMWQNRPVSLSELAETSDTTVEGLRKIHRRTGSE